MPEKPRKPFFPKRPQFDAFDRTDARSRALGSSRIQSRNEAADIKSTDYVPGVAGYRITPKFIEINGFVFPNNSIPVSVILDFVEEVQDAIGTILGHGLVYDDATPSIDVDESLLDHDLLGNLQGGTAGEYFHLTSAEHDVAQTLVGATYTPTANNSSNLDADPSVFEAQYMRVGNTITVSGRFEADATAPGLASFEMTLPVPSDLGAEHDLAGTSVSIWSGTAEIASIEAMPANNTALFQWIALDLSARDWSFHFTYQVR